MDDLSKNETQSIEEQSDCTDPEDITTNNNITELAKNLPEVLSFIQRLQDCILRQRKLIHGLYAKLKEHERQRKVVKDASTQTYADDLHDQSPVNEPKDIVEDIKRAAEDAVQQTGFVYESTSGMYYDYNTGYYYDAELSLYYDGHNGIYYYFDESSKSFQFHSQLPPGSHPNTDISEAANIVTVPENSQDVEIGIKILRKKIKLEEKEEGECSDTNSDNENDNKPNIMEIVSDPVINCVTSKNNNDSEHSKTKPSCINLLPSNDEIANAWPPCLRVVVKETGLDSLKIGSLFIVTCVGGTLGREGDHAILIPDISISKHHASVSYSEEAGNYQLVDLGSRNGTYVDGQRVSVALRESDPVPLAHGTMVRVGNTNLECHLHLGRDTCTDCEPGCAIKQPDGAAAVDMALDHETREARHRSELRRLRKRFGLDKLRAGEVNPSLAAGYQDRAEERRKTVGSIDHNAKTETASVHQSIKKTNKGFKMLSKMGWSEGQSLGKDSSSGITQPVLVEQRADKVGLGSDAVSLPAADKRLKNKTEIWKKAQKRFQQLDE